MEDGDHLGVFLVKVLFFLFFFMWIRWTLPRFRYDQLMSLGWKVMLPLVLGYVIVIAAATLGLDALGIPTAGPLYGLPCWDSMIVLGLIMVLVIDRGRLISPASARVRAAELTAAPRGRAYGRPWRSRPREGRE